jgi:flagellar hook-associated protein 3 FlgL
MTINSIPSSISLLGTSINNIKTQLGTLQVQLATGQKAATYSGMGSGEGFAVAARMQLANISGYQNTTTNVTTTINVTNAALQQISDTAGEVQSSAADQTQVLNSYGQTTGQTSAISQLSSILGVLNTQAGNGYVFSGAATSTPPVATIDQILNGTATQAGLKKLISERQQADLGAASPSTGRVVSTAPSTTAPTTVSLAEDTAGSPFGLKLNSVTSSLTGATVTGPTGSPASLSVDLGSTNPNAGDQLNVTFNLPDGTTKTVQLTATTTTPPPTGTFLIGATPADTATNLNNALNSSVTTLANTSLVASSAIQASNDFFGSPPMRVSGSPLNAATSLVAGTASDTVSWYTGGNSSGSARASQIAQVGPSLSVQYGVQANETGIVSQLKAVAVYAAFSALPSNSNASAQISALSAGVAQALSTQTSHQSISDIQTDLANAQTTMQSATALNTQTQATLQSLVSNIETVSPDQVASQILALQTSLQASYQTTSMLSQLSLVKYLPVPSG